MEHSRVQNIYVYIYIYTYIYSYGARAFHDNTTLSTNFSEQTVEKKNVT